MKRRIHKNILGLAVLTILLVSGIFVYFYNLNIHKELQTEIEMDAKYAAAAYELTENPMQYLERLKADEAFRVTLIQRDGTVLYDSITDIQQMENHLERPEVREALESGTGSETRTSDTLKSNTYYYAIKLSNGQILRLANKKDSPLQTFFDLLPFLSGVGLLILLCSYLIAHRLAAGIAKKVNDIDLQHPTKEAAFEELWPLLNRIEKQNAQLKDQMADLMDQQEKFTTITKNMTEGLILLDTESKILFINQSCKELFQAPSIRYKEKHIFALNRSDELIETVKAALLGATHIAKLKLGEKQVQLLGNPVRENEKVTGAVIFVMDITAHHRAERMRKEFSANVSHELKTPLTSISGYAELMKNELVQEKDIPGFSGKIYDEAQRLLTLVNDIISISQLDEKDIMVSKESVDLYELADEICTRLRPVAEKLSITLELKGKSIKIITVRQMMYDMLYNLCDNGIKYNIENGTVIISIYEKDEHPVICVSDTGIGIPMEYQERIFERFYRIDKSHSKQTGGTGLGLSIVKHVVEYQGGYIEIHSDKEEGTTITVNLQA